MTSESHCKNQWWAPEVPTKKDPPGAGRKPALPVRWELRRGVEYWADSVPGAGRYHTLFSTRRTFLQSLSRSALVLSLENVFALACRASWNSILGRPEQAPAGLARATPNPTGVAAPASSL